MPKEFLQSLSYTDISVILRVVVIYYFLFLVFWGLLGISISIIFKRFIKIGSSISDLKRIGTEVIILTVILFLVLILASKFNGMDILNPYGYLKEVQPLT